MDIESIKQLLGNGKIFGDTIQNFSALPVRRVERTAREAGRPAPTPSQVIRQA